MVLVIVMLPMIALRIVLVNGVAQQKLTNAVFVVVMVLPMANVTVMAM